jgi:DNA-binding MarR family transcriptional regulator
MVDPVTGDDAVEMVEHELAVLLRRARAFSGQFAREFHPDLDAGAYALMVWLDDVGSARLTDMATFFGVGKPTVSRQVQLLERLALVTRTTDDNDRRAQTLSLTPDGAARLRLVRDARRGRFRTMLSPWPQPDVAALGDLLGRLNQAMGAPRPDDAPADDTSDNPTDHSSDNPLVITADPAPPSSVVRQTDGALANPADTRSARPDDTSTETRAAISTDTRAVSEA